MIPAELLGMLSINGDIVVVEDDDILRPLIVDMLSVMDAQVLAFTTADDALSHVRDHNGHCSMLIADHGLPGGVTGTKLAEIFRANWPTVAVIVTSGYELEPSTLPNGVAYLQKPWGIDHFIRIIAALLQPGAPATRF